MENKKHYYVIYTLQHIRSEIYPDRVFFGDKNCGFSKWHLGESMAMKFATAYLAKCYAEKELKMTFEPGNNNGIQLYEHD
jgi:nicotinic acid mononucleotide adenylyltransferase